MAVTCLILRPSPRVAQEASPVPARADLWPDSAPAAGLEYILADAQPAAVGADADAQPK